jgi:uncharacterized membrane protein (UPF0127 family)
MTRPCWLVSKANVLASAELATSHADRGRGFLGRDHAEGALVLDHTRWIHTIGMRFTLDVAYVDRDGIVIRTSRMRPYRIGPFVRDAARVVEAQAGSFERWGLRLGDVVELRE